MINRTILRPSCGLLVYTLILSKPERIAFTWLSVTCQSRKWKIELVWWLVFVPHCAQNSQLNAPSLLFSCLLFFCCFFFLKKCHFHIHSLKSEPCFCSATWQVSARCLAFHAQSSLAISFKYTDKQTNSSPVVPLPELTNYLHTSRRLHTGLFHHRPDIVLGSGIPASQHVFV